jgi:hypothetical protein
MFRWLELGLRETFRLIEATSNAGPGDWALRAVTLAAASATTTDADFIAL